MGDSEANQCESDLYRANILSLRKPQLIERFSYCNDFNKK